MSDGMPLAEFQLAARSGAHGQNLEIPLPGGVPDTDQSIDLFQSWSAT